MKIYLDDVRTPVSKGWTVVKNYEEFLKLFHDINFDEVELISLDHDLADEHYRPSMYNPDGHYTGYYTDGTFKEKTGYECAKFLVEYCQDNNKTLPQVYVHSMNPIGCKNIKSLIDNFYKFTNVDKICEIKKVDFYC